MNPFDERKRKMLASVESHRFDFVICVDNSPRASVFALPNKEG